MSAEEILRKLRVKSGGRAAIINAPDSYQHVLAALPPGTQVTHNLDGRFDFIHCFVAKQADLEQQVPELRGAMKPETVLWISYPKGTAVPTDLKRDIVRDITERGGLKAVSQVAIDDVWSALCFKMI